MWQTCTEPPARVQLEQIAGMQLINTVCKVLITLLTTNVYLSIHYNYTKIEFNKKTPNVRHTVIIQL